MGGEEYALGVLIGNYIARIASEEIKEPVMIGEYRIHHYWALIVPFFTNNRFVQGLATGIGLHDLPDLVEDFDAFIKKVKKQLGI